MRGFESRWGYHPYLARYEIPVIPLHTSWSRLAALAQHNCAPQHNCRAGIALGHPVGASGARIMAKLLREMWHNFSGAPLCLSVLALEAI